MSEESTLEEVRGERGRASVTRSLSRQSRVSNILAIGLMSALGLGSLTWYYANAVMRQGRTRENAVAASATPAQGDAPLPGLGRIEPPPAPLFDSLVAPQQPVMNLAEAPVVSVAPSTPSGTSPTPAKTPQQSLIERELSGAVFAVQSAASVASAASVSVEPRVTSPATEQPQTGGLAPLLRPSGNAPVAAHMLPAQRLLLPKGAFIDCTLETAIDSSLPGMTTCVMATDAFGVDGKVVLLERGTKLVGETRGQLQQGAARLFVLWTEARSPKGVIVPLDSPGADELGRSGLAGEVNRHFWQRFGAAMLVSVIDGAVQAAAQSSHGSGGNVVLNPSSSQDVLTEILRNTLNVPPTIVKQNGDRIQVFVARDVDFRSVYELRAVAGRN